MNIPFTVINLKTIIPTTHPGDTGEANWHTLQLPGLRMRIVEYSAGYMADHWCQKGHIVHCLEGEVVTEQENGDRFVLQQGMTYIVSDDMSSHRSLTTVPVKLFIVDGDFLKLRSEE